MSETLTGAWDDKLKLIRDHYARTKTITENDYKYITSRLDDLSAKLSKIPKDAKGRDLYEKKYDAFHTFLQKISSKATSSKATSSKANSTKATSKATSSKASSKKNSTKTTLKELSGKQKEYKMECQRAHERKKYLEQQYKRDMKQLTSITDRCNFEHVELEYKSKFNIPTFQSLHPTLYDMKADMKESVDTLTRQLDKIYSYGGSISVGNILFYNLLYKYRSKCFLTTLNETNIEPPPIVQSAKSILGLILDPSYAFDLLFGRKYIDFIGSKLKRCISESSDVILIHLILFNKSTKMGHSNMIIYKPDEKKVYRFEPHGSSYMHAELDKIINTYLALLFEVKLKPYIGNVSYIRPLHICPTVGLQLLEEQLSHTKHSREGGGYCMMWSLLFAEMVLLNPKKPLMDIMNELLVITNKDPAQLQKLIRGYVKLSTDILKELSAIFFKHDIESYNDFYSYLESKKDNKHNTLLRLLTLFSNEPRN